MSIHLNQTPILCWQVGERRNLTNDINRQFKTNAAQTQSIAISSDTDNSGGSVTAAFADIHFTSGKCKFK